MLPDILTRNVHWRQFAETDVMLSVSKHDNNFERRSLWPPDKGAVSFSERGFPD
jgi:hypothetical protein